MGVPAAAAHGRPTLLHRGQGQARAEDAAVAEEGEV